MKKLLGLFLVSLICQAADTPISGLPTATTISSNTFILISDMDATPKSKKMLTDDLIHASSNAINATIGTLPNPIHFDAYTTSSTNAAVKSLESGMLGVSGALAVGGGQWSPLGIAATGSEPADQNYALEPSVIFENGVFKLWCSVKNSGAEGIAYWEGADPLHLVRYPGVVLSGYARAWVMKDASFIPSQPYKLYGTLFPAQQRVDLYTSADGITWNPYKTSLFTITGTTNLGNIAVYHDTNCTVTGYPADCWVGTLDYRDVPDSNHGWYDHLITSPNGTNWTVRSILSGPMLTGMEGRPDMGGCWITKNIWTNVQNVVVGSFYFMYGHAAYPQPGSPLVPSDIYRMVSGDLTNWYSAHWNGSTSPEIMRDTFDDGAFDGAGQVADPFLVEANGKTYMFYDSLPDQSFGSGEFKTKVVVADKNLAAVMNFPYKIQSILAGSETVWGDVRIGNPRVDFLYPIGTSGNGRLMLAGYNPNLTFIDTSRNAADSISMDYLGGNFSLDLHGQYPSFTLRNSSSGSHPFSLITYAGGTGVDGSFTIFDEINRKNALFIDSTSRVGINTHQVSAQLQVGSEQQIAMRISSPNYTNYPLTLDFLAHGDTNQNLANGFIQGEINFVGAQDGLIDVITNVLVESIVGSVTNYTTNVVAGWVPRWHTNAQVRAIYDGNGTTTNGILQLSAATIDLAGKFNALGATFGGPVVFSNTVTILNGQEWTTNGSMLSSNVVSASNVVARTSLFAATASVNDDAYNASSWNGSTNVPTKNAIRDKIESMASGSQTPWASDINAATFMATNLGGLQFGGAGTSIVFNASVNIATNVTAQSGIFSNSIVANGTNVMARIDEVAAGSGTFSYDLNVSATFSNNTAIAIWTNAVDTGRVVNIQARVIGAGPTNHSYYDLGATFARMGTAGTLTLLSANYTVGYSSYGAVSNAYFLASANDIKLYAISPDNETNYWVAKGTLLTAANALGTEAAAQSSDTTNAWDNFLEGFQTATTGYESNIWTGFGTTANISPAYDTTSLTTYKPPGVCNQSLHIVVPDEGTETYIRGDLGAGQIIDLDTIQTDVSLCFYLEANISGNLSSCPMFSFNADGGFGVYNGLEIQSASSTPQIRAHGTANSNWISIATGQWYTIVISFDTAQAAGGSNIKIWSNGSQVGSTQTFQRSAVDLRYIFCGTHDGLDANEGFTADWDIIGIKTN